MGFLKSNFCYKAFIITEFETALKNNKDIKQTHFASGNNIDRERFLI